MIETTEDLIEIRTACTRPSLATPPSPHSGMSLHLFIFMLPNMYNTFF